MTPVATGPLATLTTAWFDRYCRFALWRHFHAVRVYRDDASSLSVIPSAAEGPRRGSRVEERDQARSFDSPRSLRMTEGTPRIVVAATHQSFWDGIVLGDLLRRFGWRRRFVMIDQKQVDRHPFFPRIGGFGVDLDDPADRRRAIGYASSLLREANEPAALVIFPQGRIEPDDADLSAVSRSPELIARRADAPVLHVAIRYRFWFAQRPEVLVATGDDLPSARVILDDACRDFAAGQVLVRGRRSIKDWRLSGRGHAAPDERERQLVEDV
ncbi:MAG: lysophospholipid acyltransferase family protein [Planctomycetota bacterium]